MHAACCLTRRGQRRFLAISLRARLCSSRLRALTRLSLACFPRRVQLCLPVAPGQAPPAPTALVGAYDGAAAAGAPPQLKRTSNASGDTSEAAAAAPLKRQLSANSAFFRDLVGSSAPPKLTRSLTAFMQQSGLEPADGASLAERERL